MLTFDPCPVPHLKVGDVVTIPLAPMPTYWQRLLGIVGFPTPKKPHVDREFVITSVTHSTYDTSGIERATIPDGWVTKVDKI